MMNNRIITREYALNIPEELSALKQWVLNKPNKVPFSCSGKAASTVNPDTWGSFEEVLTVFQRDKQYSGIGFVFVESGGYAGIDLDH